MSSTGHPLLPPALLALRPEQTGMPRSCVSVCRKSHLDVNLPDKHRGICPVYVSLYEVVSYKPSMNQDSLDAGRCSTSHVGYVLL